MAMGIQSHTFGETYELTVIQEGRGGRLHMRTSDGRDVLAKPTSNPAYAQGLMYWITDYPEDIRHFLNGLYA